MTQPLQIIRSVTQEASIYALPLFPVYDENTIIDNRFCKKVILKRELLIQLWVLECFPGRIFVKTLK